MPDIFGKGTATKQVCQCNLSYHSQPQYDWIVLDNMQKTSKSGDISYFSFAQLQILFQYRHEDNIYHLACIQHFKRLLKQDPEMEMSILECRKTYEIIQINSIIQNVHLIPYFDTPRSARDALKAKTDEYNFSRYLLNPYSDVYSFVKFL